jgi:hypothetical protein
MVWRTQTSPVKSKQKAHPLNKIQILFHADGIPQAISDRVLDRFETEERLA